MRLSCVEWKPYYLKLNVCVIITLTPSLAGETYTKSAKSTFKILYKMQKKHNALVGVWHKVIYEKMQ